MVEITNLKNIDMDINSIDIESIVEKGTSAEDNEVENIDGERSGEAETAEADKDTATENEDPESASEEVNEDSGEEETPEGEETKPEVDFESQLKEKIDPRVESLDALPKLLDELDQLREDVKKEPELVFPNDRAKKAYEYLANNEGEFKELSTQMHSALALGDPEKMDPKQAQLEAFLLERKDLTRTKGEKLFNARYEKFFGEMEDDDVLLQDEHELKTKSAIDTIQKMQDSVRVKQAPEDIEAEDKQVNDSIEVAKTVEKTLQAYEGIELSFGKEGEDILTVQPKEGDFKEKLKEAMLNPAGIIEQAIEARKGSDGNLDWKAYADFIVGIMYPDMIRQEIYKQGSAAGQVIPLKKSKNLSSDKQGDQAPAPKTESIYDSWAKAASK